MKASSLVRSSTDRRRRSLRRALAGSIATALAAHVVMATTYKWDANGAGPGQVDGSGFWNTSNQNWLNSGTNVQWNNGLNLDAQFGNGGPQAGTVVLTGEIVVGNITFSALGPGYTVSGNPGSTGAQLNFSGTTPTVTADADAALKVQLIGKGITKEGAGRLVIRGAPPISGSPDDQATTSNAYTGLFKVNNGLVQFGGNYAAEAGIVGDFGVAVNGTLRMNQSNIIKRTAIGSIDGYLELAGYSETFGALTGSGVVTSATGTPTIQLGNGVQTFSGSLRGPISLIIAGDDGSTTGGVKQTLSGVNSYTGGTTIQNGVNAANAGSLTLANTLAAYRSAITVQPNGGLKFAPGIGSFLIGGIAGPGNTPLADTAGNGITLRAGTNDINSLPVYTGILSDAGNGSFSNFTKTGLSTQTFAPSTPHTYLGATGIDRGKLILDFSNMSTPTNMINSASVLRFGGGILQINAGSTATSQTFGGFVVGPGGGTIAFSAPSSSALLTLPNTWNRNTGGTLNLDLRDFNSAISSSPALTNDVVPWANVLDNTDVGFATSSAGFISRYVNASSVTSEASFTSATTNYDAQFAANPSQTLSGDRAANTIRSVLSAASFELNGHTLSTNALMNAAASDLVIQAGNGGNLAAGTTNSLAIHLAGQAGGGTLTQGNIVIRAPIVNNGANPSSVTVQAVVGSTATLTLSGASTYSGGTFLNGGTTIVGASSTSNSNGVVSGPFGTGKLTFGGGNIEGSTGFGTTLVIGNNIDFLRDTAIPAVSGGTKSLNFAGTVTLLDGARTFSTSNTLDTIFSGPIVDGANAAGLTITSAGTTSRVLFQGANTYTGLTTVDRGILQIGNGLFSGTLGTGPVLVNSNGTLSFNRADDVTILNEITGAGILQQDKASTVLLAFPHDTIGKVVIGAEGGIIDVGSVSLSLNGFGVQGLASGTVKASAGGRLVLDTVPVFQVADARTLNVSAPIVDGTTNTIKVTASGSAGTTGSGIVALTGANTYTGATNIIAGTLAATRINSLVTDTNTGAVHYSSSSLGAPSTLTDATINLGTSSGGLPPSVLRYVGTGETTDRPLNVVGTGAKAGRVDMEGTGTLKFLAGVSADAVGTKMFTLGGNSSGVGEMAGVISDVGGGLNAQLSLIKTGSGTWRLSAANTYSGITQINSGKLVAVASGGSANIIPANNNSGAVTGDGIAAMHMRGGTFQYIGAGGTQEINGVGLITGANVFDATPNGSPVILDLSGGDPVSPIPLARTPTGAVSLPADGTVDFQTSTPGQTVDIAGPNTLGNVTIKVGTTALDGATVNNISTGIIGPWATVNKGAALATVQNNPANANTYLAVTPFAGYFDVNQNGGIGNSAGKIGVVATNYANNTLHFRFGTTYTYNPATPPALASGINTIKTLTQNSAAQDITINMSANTLRIGAGSSTSLPVMGGIYITPQAKSLTLGQTPGEGSGLTVNIVANASTPWEELILGNFSATSELKLNTNIINPTHNSSFLQVPTRVILSGPGVVTLNGPANSFNGGVYLLNGTLNLNTSTALGAITGPSIGTGAVNLGIIINGGNLGNTSGGIVRIPDGRSQNWAADFTYDSVNPIVFGGGAGGSITMTEALLANVGFTRKVTVANASMAIGGAIGGSAALVKDGAGDLLMYANGASFFDGGLTIRQGTVAALANGTTFGANGVTLGDTSGSGNAAIAGGPNAAGYANDISVVAGSTGTKTIRNAFDYATKFNGTITAGAPVTIGAIGSGSVNLAGLLTGSGLVTVAAGTDRQNIVDFSSSNGTFRGGVQVASGVLRIGTSSSLGDAISATSVLPGGSLDLNGQNVSEPLVLAGLGARGAGALVNNSGSAAVSNGGVQITSDIAIGGAGNLTVNGVIGGNNGGPVSFGVAKTGTGTTTLTAHNAYTGITFVRGGTLIDDMSLNDTVIDPKSPLVLANSTFQLTGAAGVSRSQVLAGLHASEGASSVVLNNTGTETVLDLREMASTLGFTHTTGTIDFRSAHVGDFGAAARILTKESNSAAGVIGAWATVNAGAALATNNNGVVTAFTGYTDIAARGPSVIPNDPNAHVRLNSAGTSGNVTLAAASNSIFTLTQNTATAATVDASAGTLRLGSSSSEGGVFITPGSAGLTIGTAPNAGGGILTAGGSAANTAGAIIFNNSSASALTVNSTIADNGVGSVFITKNGTGLLTLNNANTFTGNTNLQQGQLNLGHALALGSTGNLIVSSGVIDNTSGAPMTISGLGFVWGGDFTFAGSQPLTFSAVNRPVWLSDSLGQGTRTITIPNAALTLNEGIEGGMALVKSGAGTLNLSGASSGFHGGLTIAAGTVALLDENATLGADTVQIGDTSNNTDSATLIAGLRLGGYDNKIVTSNHTNGAFTGTLTLKSVAGSTLRLNGGVAINDDVTVTTQGTGGINLNGAITGNGKLTLDAGSALGNVIQLNGDNTYFLGQLEIDGGTVKLGNAGALGTNYLGTTILNGAALELNGNSISDNVVAAGTGINGKGVLLNNSSTPVSVTGGFQILTTGTVGGRVVGETSVGGSGNITFNNSISTGSGFLTFAKQGTGTVTLYSGTTSTYLGQTLVRRGTLIEDLTNVSTPGITGTINVASQLALDGGTFQLSGQGAQPNGNVKTQTFNGTGTLPIGGTTYGTFLTGGSSNIVIDQPATSTSGQNVPVLKLALGTIGRSGGTVNFSLLRGDATRFANGSPVSGTTASNAQIAFSNTVDASGILGAWATMTSPTNGTAFASKDSNGLLFEYTGYTDIAPGAAIANDPSPKNVRINTNGSGNVTLSAAVTDVNTLVQRLTLPTTVDTAGQQLRVGAVGGILQFNTLAQQGGGLTIGTSTAPGVAGTVTAGGNAVANNPGELIISNFSTSAGITVNSAIVNNGTGAVKVTKGAAGTVTLANTNTYTGGTFVEAGTLLVTGSIQGSTTVHTDATLGGTGSIAGAVTVGLAGNLSPGTTGAGTLSTGSLSLADSAQFKFDLGGKSAGQFDSVNVTGTVTLGTLNAGPSLVASFINGFNAVPGDSFTLINNDGTSDAIVGTFATGNTYAVGNYVFNVNYAGGDGNDLVLTVAVPEPGSAALLFGAAAPFLGLRRFRRRAKMVD